MTANTDRLTARIDAMIAARNAAHDAQQRFNYAWPSVDGRDEITDALYEATHELINRIDNLIGSTEWQNLMLGLDRKVELVSSPSPL